MLAQLAGPAGVAVGRNVEKIIDHLVEADSSYLASIAAKFKRDSAKSSIEALPHLRQAILDALDQAVRGKLPQKRPRGGSVWPARYFARRVAWHLLDHTWEIEDRIL